MTSVQQHKHQDDNNQNRLKFMNCIGKICIYGGVRPVNDGPHIVAMLKLSNRKVYCRHHDLANRKGISVLQMTINLFQFSFFTHPCVIPGFVTRVERLVPLVEKDMHTTSGLLHSPRVFCRFTVIQSFVDFVCV